MSSPPAAACVSSSASASISARARQRDASLSVRRCAASASRSASSAARSSRASSVSSGDTAGLALDLGPDAFGFDTRRVGFTDERFERGPVGLDLSEIGAYARQLRVDRARARRQLFELLRGALELALGHGDRHDTERLDPRIGVLDLDARRRE